MIIKIRLDDNIKDFEVKDMEDLITQVTQQLKDQDGNNLSEDDKLNAKWMNVYLDQKKIKLEEGMILNLNCSIKNDNLVRNYVWGGNLIRRKRKPRTEFILKPYIENKNNLGINFHSTAAGVTTINLAKKGRYYKW